MSQHSVFAQELIRNTKKEITQAGGLPVHPLANEDPLPTDESMDALFISISKDGQRDPILVWRGKIIDGRCRACICAFLKKEVIVKNLPYNSSMKTLEIYAMQSATRRHDTPTQRAIKAAYHAAKNPNEKNKSIMAEFGVIPANFYAAIKLVKIAPSTAEILFKGYSVKVADDKNSKNIQVVARFYEALTENNMAEAIARMDASKDPSGPRTRIQTAAGKDFYDNAIELLEEYSFTRHAVKVFIANIADRNTKPKPSLVNSIKTKV